MSVTVALDKMFELTKPSCQSKSTFVNVNDHAAIGIPAGYDLLVLGHWLR